jgi:hypothetical protein
MKYERGKHPNTHAPAAKRKMVEKQLRIQHPWRASYPLTSRGISPDFIPGQRR